MALFGSKQNKDSRAPESPWAREEAERNRVKFVHRLTVPTASLFTARILMLAGVGFLIFQEVRIWRMDSAVKDQKPVVIRVNDVGRAELVRLDTDYIPEEPEVRYHLMNLVQRMFNRNGFTLPEAIQKNGAYLVGEAMTAWAKSARADLPKVAAGQNLGRVRILYCHIDSIGSAKSKNGTRAILRYAFDPMSESGAMVGASQGFEIVMDFRVGDWIQTQNSVERENWLGWNPLGLRISRYQVHQYMGADVKLPDGVIGNTSVVPMSGKTGDFAPGTAPDITNAQNALPTETQTPVTPVTTK